MTQGRHCAGRDCTVTPDECNTNFLDLISSFYLLLHLTVQPIYYPSETGALPLAILSLAALLIGALPLAALLVTIFWLLSRELLSVPHAKHPTVVIQNKSRMIHFAIETTVILSASSGKLKSILHLGSASDKRA